MAYFIGNCVYKRATQVSVRVHHVKDSDLVGVCNAKRK